jgi:molybdopterin synthase catalytic subunit
MIFDLDFMATDERCDAMCVYVGIVRDDDER